MQHPSKPLAKTRQGTLAGSAEQDSYLARHSVRRAARGPLRWRAPQPAARWQGTSSRDLFRRQLAGH